LAGPGLATGKSASGAGATGGGAVGFGGTGGAFGSVAFAMGSAASATSPRPTMVIFLAAFAPGAAVGAGLPTEVGAAPL